MKSAETCRPTRWSCPGEGAYRSWGGHGRARVGRGGMRPSPAWVTPRRLGRGPQGRQVGRADSVPCAALAPIETVFTCLTEKRNVLQSNILVAFRAHSFASPRHPSFFLHIRPEPHIAFSHTWGGRVYLSTGCAVLDFFLVSSAVVLRARCQISSIYCLSILYALHSPFRQVAPSRATPFLSIHRCQTLIQSAALLNCSR